MAQALLVIDVQKDLVEGNGGEVPIFEPERLFEAIGKAVEQAEQAGARIVFVRDKSVGGGEGEGFDVHPALRIPPDAAVFDKTATSSFHETGLLEHLREHGVRHCVIAGCMTQYCIDTAVRAATLHGFDVTLVRDGHSTSDSPVLSAEQIIAHHNATLHGYDNNGPFALVRPTEEALFDPPHDQYR
ncbi:cysteine hydrolase [Paenibacillus albicereus]|uniref:Cysteine hydrolase n=1 Tax=Paenibacillus albicereus TaxID=2726185 RepID=A0A6H2GU80_9BACL|nr:cysteine hydrolase family protein [Paenibacillus albicereus]QJC50726.1 cysteine hydrolase [Paenibacillus albicereus]